MKLFETSIGLSHQSILQEMVKLFLSPGKWGMHLKLNNFVFTKNHLEGLKYKNSVHTVKWSVQYTSLSTGKRNSGEGVLNT